jgi:small-conductance mechanosensitive channel
LNAYFLIQVEVPTPLDLLEQISFGTVLTAVLVLAVAFLIARFADAGLEALAKTAPRARFTFKMWASILRFGIWFAAVLLILFWLIAPTRETTLAVLASVGIAVGLGAQDLVKNLVGGLVILVDRPYQLGDRVKIGEAYGEIDHIGLRSTKLTTPDDTRVTIPNSDVLTGMAWNANSSALDCQVVTELHVPHDADPVTLMELAYEAAYSSPYLLLSKPVVVRVIDRFQDGPYTLLKIKGYVYDHRLEPALQHDITVRAKCEFLRRGMLLRWSRHDEGPSSAELMS